MSNKTVTNTCTSVRAELEQEMWDLMTEKALQQSSEDTGGGGGRPSLPIEILLSLAERILTEMDRIIKACLQDDLPESTEDEDDDLAAVIRLPEIVCRGLGVSGPRRRRVKSDVPGDMSRFVTAASCKSNQDEDSLSDEDGAKDEGCKSELEEHEAKLDFKIENRRFVCLTENCEDTPGFASFLELKSHYEDEHKTKDGRRPMADVVDRPLDKDLPKASLKEQPVKDLKYKLSQIKGLEVCPVENVEVEPEVMSDGDDGGDVDEERVPDDDDDDDYDEDDEGDGADYFGDWDVTEKEDRPSSPSQQDDSSSSSLPQQQSFVCSYCYLHLGSAKDLTRHKRTHAGPFRCKDCDFVGKHMFQLKKHRKEAKHKPSPSGTRSSSAVMAAMAGYDPFTCEECGKMFASKCLYKQHQDTHVTTNDCICESCGKGFKNKRYLMSHIKDVHSGEKHPCPDCGKIFRQASGYRHHRRMKHADNPPERSQCEFCEKTFRTKMTLRFHQAIVHGRGDVDVLHCDQCPTKFVSEAKLREHVKARHLGVKHTCPNCSKEFNHKYSMTKHMKDGKCAGGGGQVKEEVEQSQQH